MWLLEVHFAGVVHRFSTEDVEVLTSDGDTLVYIGRLPSEIREQAFALFTSEPEPLSISFDLAFDVDVSLQIARGHALAGSRAEFSLWVDGDTYESRYPILVGRVIEPTYGDEFEDVSFTIEDEQLDDRGVWPPTSAAISTSTWANADDAVIGRAYPWPFGCPGVYTESDGSAGLTSGSPAYYVDTANSYILIAYGDVDASSVTIINASAGDSSVFSVSTMEDGAGQLVSICDVSVPGGLTVATGDEYFVRWDQGGGGARLRPGGEQQNGAGSLLMFMLRRSTVRVNSGQITAIAAVLDRIEVGGAITDHEVPSEWVSKNLMPILPVSLVNGPAGIEALLWRPEAKVRDALEVLEVGRNVERAGRVQVERDAIANEISLSFAPRARVSGEYRRRRTVSGRLHIDSTTTSGVVRSDTWSCAAVRASVDTLSDISNGDNGIRELEIKSDILWDTASADVVLAYQAAASAFPVRSISVDGGLELSRVPRGAEVLITDSSIHLDSQVAIVVGRGLGELGTVLQLQVIRHPSRDGVPT